MRAPFRLFIALAFCSAVVWPAGSARPATSNLNFAAGQTIANTVIVPVGTDGKVQVLNAAAAGVAVVVDLTGYVRGGSATKPGTVVAVPAARIADGRTGQQIGAVPATGTAAIRVAGLAGIPAGASQVILTVTVVRPSNNGFLVAWPSGAVRPEVTTMNFQAGRDIAATVVVPAGRDGRSSCTTVPRQARRSLPTCRGTSWQVRHRLPARWRR